MSAIINFEVFLLASILLNLTPGADTAYILGRSLAQGRRAGVLSAVGISSGTLIHITLATFGLTTVLAQSATVFAVVKNVGAAYLIFLGIQALRSTSRLETAETLSEGMPNSWRIFGAGMLTNVFNPKVALFFLAFIPQFIDSSAGDPTSAFILLGLAFMLPGTVWCIGLALFAAHFSEKLRANNRVQVWLSRISGAVFIALGVRLAIQNR